MTPIPLYTGEIPSLTTAQMVEVDRAMIDITGVQVVDTQVAQALVQTARAVRLLGAQVILTGIQSPMAQTLMHLGVDLEGIITYRTLQAGVAAVLAGAERAAYSEEFSSG